MALLLLEAADLVQQATLRTVHLILYILMIQALIRLPDYRLVRLLLRRVVGLLRLFVFVAAAFFATFAVLCLLCLSALFGAGCGRFVFAGPSLDLVEVLLLGLQV